MQRTFERRYSNDVLDSRRRRKRYRFLWCYTYVILIVIHIVLIHIVHTLLTKLFVDVVVLVVALLLFVVEPPRPS